MVVVCLLYFLWIITICMLKIQFGLYDCSTILAYWKLAVYSCISTKTIVVVIILFGSVILFFFAVIIRKAYLRGSMVSLSNAATIMAVFIILLRSSQSYDDPWQDTTTDNSSSCNREPWHPCLPMVICVTIGGGREYLKFKLQVVGRSSWSSRFTWSSLWRKCKFFT